MVDEMVDKHNRHIESLLVADCGTVMTKLLLLERVEVETGDGGVHANRHGVGDETETDL